MAFIIWDQSLSVNVKRCDDEHRKLLSMLNGLSQAVRVGKGHSVIKLVIQDLDTYAKTHFATEEGYFAQTNYPASAVHRAEHQGFVVRVNEFKQGLYAGQAEPAAVVEFMQEWLKKHILHSDRLYTTHLNAHGVS
jgi:hemerythrin-like metal-binding protein